MDGFTDKQQSLILFISAMLIALAGINIDVTGNIWISTVLAVIGAIGFALKEAAGGKSN